MDNNSPSFLSLEHFQNRYDIRVKPLMFFGIVSAVKSLQRQIPGTHQQHDSSFNTSVSIAKIHLELFSNNKWYKTSALQPVKMLTRETFFKQQTLVQRSEN